MPDQSTENIKLLLLKVAEGDENSFAQLFRIYFPKVGEFIMRITESEQLTEEIVQDVFLKIWINRESLAELDSFKAYLFVVARNHAFNCLKQIAKEKMRKKEWANFVLPHTSRYVEETSTVNIGDLIDEAVELLPPRQKKVYTLSRIDHMKQEEIARELNISLETVKKHMVLAIRFLKNYLRKRIGISIIIMEILFKE